MSINMYICTIQGERIFAHWAIVCFWQFFWNFQNYKANILNTFFLGKSYVLVWAGNGLGYFLGNFSQTYLVTLVPSSTGRQKRCHSEVVVQKNEQCFFNVHGQLGGSTIIPLLLNQVFFVIIECCKLAVISRHCLGKFKAGNDSVHEQRAKRHTYWTGIN
jgi:hypothetical protein